MQKLVTTLLKYTDISGRIRTKKTKSFNYKTTLADIHDWISKWREWTGKYELVIKDQVKQYVDFDDEYIEEFKPFGTEENQLTVPILVQLKTIQYNSHIQTSSIGTIPSIDIRTETQSNHDNTIYNSIKSSTPITIDKKEPSLIFIRNVNDIQRDQYSTDITETDGKRRGTYVQLQGNKEDLKGHKKQASVQPNVKIQKAITIEERAAFTLLIYIIYECCENGKRILYHNNERQFLIENKSKVTNQDEDNFRFKPVIILNNNDNIFNENGFELTLKTCVIIHSKTNHKKARHIFCELTNRYSEEINYETTRLAFLLVKNNEILWNTLTLSNAMIFPKAGNEIGDISATDINDQIFEKIPVRILKRKKDINQLSTIVKRLTRDKKQKRINTTDSLTLPSIQESSSSLISNQFQNQVEYPESLTTDALFMSNFSYQTPQPPTTVFTNGYTSFPNTQNMHQESSWLPVNINPSNYYEYNNPNETPYCSQDIDNSQFSDGN